MRWSEIATNQNHITRLLAERLQTAYRSAQRRGGVSANRSVNLLDIMFHTGTDETIIVTSPAVRASIRRRHGACYAFHLRAL